MYSVTIYEATKPDGNVFTARIEGRACVGVGKTISDALHELADELIGQSHAAGEIPGDHPLQAKPYAYSCPANCGCLWRDNGDATMSLFGPNSKSCGICEPMALSDLVPVYRPVSISARIGGAANFITDWSMPSCSTCGTIDAQKIVCTACGSFLAEAIAAAIKNNPQFANYVANLTAETVVAPTNTGVDNPGIENGAANTYQVGGSHYKTAIEHWDYVIANDIPYLEAQVIKYLTRWRKKNGMEDVLKSKHYLDKLIEVETEKAKRKGADTTMRGTGC